MDDVPLPLEEAVKAHVVLPDVKPSEIDLDLPFTLQNAAYSFTVERVNMQAMERLAGWQRRVRSGLKSSIRTILCDMPQQVKGGKITAVWRGEATFKPNEPGRRYSGGAQKVAARSHDTEVAKFPKLAVVNHKITMSHRETHLDVDDIIKLAGNSDLIAYDGGKESLSRSWRPTCASFRSAPSALSCPSSSK